MSVLKTLMLHQRNGAILTFAPNPIPIPAKVRNIEPHVMFVFTDDSAITRTNTTGSDVVESHAATLSFNKDGLPIKRVEFAVTDVSGSLETQDIAPFHRRLVATMMTGRQEDQEPIRNLEDRVLKLEATVESINKQADIDREDRREWRKSDREWREEFRDQQQETLEAIQAQVNDSAKVPGYQGKVG